MTSVWRQARRRLPLADRADAVELLDGGRLSLPEVEQNLADLARLNRLPGGTAASIEGIGHLIGSGADARVLDVGTGRGDMPLAFAERGWRTTAPRHQPGRPARRQARDRGAAPRRDRRRRRPVAAVRRRRLRRGPRLALHPSLRAGRGSRGPRRAAPRRPSGRGGQRPATRAHAAPRDRCQRARVRSQPGDVDRRASPPRGARTRWPSSTSCSPRPGSASGGVRAAGCHAS